VGGARVVTGVHALMPTAATLADPPGNRRSITPSTEKNHACEEKRREKGWPEIDAQVHAKEGRS
jgi:hypothetical protein